MTSCTVGRKTYSLTYDAAKRLETITAGGSISDDPEYDAEGRLGRQGIYLGIYYYGAR